LLADIADLVNISNGRWEVDISGFDTEVFNLNAHELAGRPGITFCECQARARTFYVSFTNHSPEKCPLRAIAVPMGIYLRGCIFDWLRKTKICP
jgi:hypothetical protein